MEQLNYKYEIILKLFGRSWHARGLAKELEVNHMLVFRKLKELYEENVLDFKEEGKNKIYFIKKNPESRIYFEIAERYKLIKLLEKYPGLRQMVEKIQKDKRIGLAVLFGSYAKFSSNKNSDIDIYIETEDKKLKKEIESISPKINVKIGKYNKENLLIKEIERNHVVMKGVENFYEKSDFV